MLDIVAEDDRLLVVNKPAGVATMGVRPPKPCVWPEILSHLSNDANPAPFAATQGRLDFHVAGILVVAKDADTANHLRLMQEQGSIQKRYEGIVAGTVKLQAATLVDWLQKSARHRSVRIVAKSEAGAQRAELRYETTEYSARCTKLKIVLATGRKHQIRAQLSHLGHPLLGDIKYGSNVSYPHGIALVCREISLTDLDGQARSWTSPTSLEFPSEEPIEDSDNSDYRG